MIRHMLKSIAVGAGLFLTTAIPTVMSEPATQAVSKEDFDKLSAAVHKFHDDVKENFREQTDFLKKQDDRITRLEHIVRGGRETHDPSPPPSPPKRVTRIVRHYHYWCPPPWWW
jgi:hypothetical protein